MTKAESYLERIKKIDFMIRNKIVDHERYLAAAEEIGGAALGDRVLSSRNLHRGADAIGNYIDVEAEIKDLKNERLSIIKTIEQLPAMEYDVIYKTYVDCFSLKEIAYDQKCSIDTVRRNKLRGLNHVQAILDQSGM